MRLLSAELTEKLPLEPNVGLHEAPSAGNLHIASPAWWNGRHVHLLAAAYVQSPSSGFKQKGSSFLSFCQDSSPHVNGNHNAWQKFASAPPGNVPRVTTLSSISCLVQ
ncbi:hypothetical protein NC651_006593 [Populus alba x Populus x berolinensis]|nr:hypothetical protein NC651_006593 [Populus alba x Populus x berolinensis]